jgi:predicted transcriptional regulator
VKPKKFKSLTKAELRIMDVLWQKEQATVAEVAAEIVKPPLAYTTVLTMLRILEKKRVVSRVVDGRAHVYAPNIAREEAARFALGDVIGSFFGDRKMALAVQLMGEERPSDEELSSIKALIARYEENER